MSEAIIERMADEIFELKNSNSAKQRIRLCEKITELESEKAELIEFIKDIYFHKLKIGDYHVRITELCKKHGVEI